MKISRGQMIAAYFINVLMKIKKYFQYQSFILLFL